MQSGWSSTDSRGPETVRLKDLAAQLRQRIVGQTDAIEEVVPFVELFEAGLTPPGRPAGVFLLLGPTGTGKTRTVEALAEILHGNDRKLLRIDCGEFQLDHEVAKLVGAPPGYLGHRETQPMLSQQKLNAAASDRSALSIVLLDEVEKAAPSMARLLLGVLDKASLKLGDGTTVNFERSLIFMTSNLGARRMMRESRDRFGLAAALPAGADPNKLRHIGLHAVRRRFSPEFVNRVDVMVTYQPLDEEAWERILDLQLEALDKHIAARLGPAAFRLAVTERARAFLIGRGTSPEYGARELKRAIHRHLVRPLARLVLDKTTRPGDVLAVDVDDSGDRLLFRPKNITRQAA